MNTLTTNGITVSVETFFQPEQSDAIRQQFVHAYRVTIENKSDLTVQLLRRHWFIFDSIGLKREVEGKGVIGKQPTLGPGESHRYESRCLLRSEIGKMYGTYLMVSRPDNREFYVRIPEFVLTAPQRLN